MHDQNFVEIPTFASKVILELICFESLMRIGQKSYSTFSVNQHQIESYCDSTCIACFACVVIRECNQFGKWLFDNQLIKNRSKAD